MDRALPRIAVFTIVSNNYSPYAEILTDSLCKTNFGFDRFVCVVDNVVHGEWGGFTQATLVPVSEIGIVRLDDMSARYSIMELNTAAKPYMFLWLLNRGYDAVIYLDPDIFVYRPLSLVINALESGASAVLTPHILLPLEDGMLPDDHAILQSGTFNLGFAAFSKANEAHEFLEWWCRKLQYGCYSDVGANYFTDQRWCDFAPSFLEKLAVLRDPGYNLAYWNLSTRHVEVDSGGEVLVNGRPLTFFHFSGLSADKPRQVSKHQNRFDWEAIGPLRRLFADYRVELDRAGWQEAKSVPCFYSSVGTISLSDPIRWLYRDSYPDCAPQQAIDEQFIEGLCNAPSNVRHGCSGRRLTRLMEAIHKKRDDLQTAFNIGRADGVEAFIDWFEMSAVAEYGLDQRFVSQELILSRSARLPLDAKMKSHPNAGKGLAYRLLRKARKKAIETLSRL